MAKQVSIIVPVIHKESAAICKAACERYSGNFKIELLFEEDVDGIGCPKMVRKLVDKSRYENIMFIGDDTIPTEGFLDEAFAALQTDTNGRGVVFVHDGISENRIWHCHFLASKGILPYLGGEFFHTGYSHSFCDEELAARSAELGLYTYTQKSIVLHNHPSILRDKEAYFNSSYGKAYLPERFLRDKILFGKRRANKWVTPGNDYFRLSIGLPHSDELMLKQFVVSFILMSKPFDWSFQVPTLKAHDFAAVRNSLIEKSILEGCTHLVMMDTDQIYPQDTLLRLLQHKDKAVVGTRVHRRYPPFDVLMFRGNVKELHHVPDEECFSGKLVKVDSTGTGCLMINLSILPDIPAPWFAQEEGVGEDIYFTNKVSQCGKEVYVDTSIEIDHMTQYLVNRSTYELFKNITGWTWRPEGIAVPERMDASKYKETIEAAIQQLQNPVPN